MKREPRVRDDGLCACGCGAGLPRGPLVRKYAGAAIDRDPFATSRCARSYFGTLQETPAAKALRERTERQGSTSAAQAKPWQIPAAAKTAALAKREADEHESESTS